VLSTTYYFIILGGEATTFFGALFDEIAFTIPAGFSPDLGVMYKL